MIAPEISIIVPVYNTEQYLDECIKSILNQTFKRFELLLIDDGSRDNSGKICDEYALRDNRIKVFHKDNGGVSSARNLGIDHAIGDYVVFCDSDDKVKENYLETLYPYSDEDMVCCSFEQLYGNPFLLVESTDINEILEKNLHLFAFGTVWGKLYKRSIFVEHELCFNNNITMGEDILFVLSYLSCHLQRISTKSIIGYIYNNENDNSASRNIVPLQQSYEVIASLYGNFMKVSELYKWNPKNILNEYLCSQMFNIIRAIRFSNRSLLWKVKQMIRAINNKYLSILLTDKEYWYSRGNHSFLKRIFINLLFYSIQFFYFFCKIFNYNKKR